MGSYSDWDTTSNWDPVGVPQDGDSATIYDGGIVTYDTASPLYLTSVTVDGPAELHVIGSSLYADTLVAGATAPWVESEIHLSGGSLSGASLQIGRDAGSNGKFIWDGGDLNVTELHIGQGGSGTFVQDIGNYNEWYLQPHQRVVIGEQIGSYGVFEQRSGNVNAWNSQIIVGEAGRGTYRQLDGDHEVDETVIGHLAGSEGTYELLGEYAGHSTQRTVVGDAGTGHYVQMAGQHYAHELVIGRSAGSVGDYQLSGGELNTNTVNIGAATESTGTMKISGQNTTWNNSGTITVGAEMFSYSQQGTGLLELQDGALISATALIVEETGAVQGNGMIMADVTNNGMLAPGVGPGTLNIFGNYSQLAEGTLSYELGGGGDFDVNQDYLEIFGTANLAGTLSVSLLGGYDFIIGESFDVLYANMIYGSFDSLLFPIFNGMTFDIAYDLNTVRLTVVSAVPVPAAAWLFGSGVVALVGAARRHKAA